MSNVLGDLYGALAAVAAITTSLQAPAAYQCFDDCSKYLEEVKTAKRKNEGISLLPNKRAAVIKKHLVLNAPAMLVNASVIVTWGYVGLRFRPVDESKWLYVVPWCALGIAALWLILVVLYSLCSLFEARRLTNRILGAIAIILLLAIIGAGLYVNP